LTDKNDNNNNNWIFIIVIISVIGVCSVIKNANSKALEIHIGRTLTYVLRHMWGISSSIEGTIQYNHLVNSIATAATIVQNRASVNQIACESVNLPFCLSTLEFPTKYTNS